MDWSLLVFAVFLFSFLLQFIYQWVFSGRLIFHKPTYAKGKLNPVSVVICAKNEYSNLKKHLPALLEQKYPEYEVVLVDDSSTDDTRDLLKKFKEKYPHLKVINLNHNVNFLKGKKLPLSVGIKSAKHNTLVLTDADCYPASSSWLTNMQKNISSNNEIVLGYGAYEKNKGFLNSLIRYDTLSIAMNYFAFALAGLPYMGTGRNLAYKKDLFFRAKGFTSHYHTISGDDDLFVNQMATGKNTTIESNPDSFTVSVPKNSFKSWFFQKKRHFSTGKHYKKKHKFLLALFGISHFMFYVSLIMVFLFTKYWLWGIILFIIRTIGLMINYYYSSKMFNEKILFLFSPIYDIFFAFLNPVILITGFLYGKNKWK